MKPLAPKDASERSQAARRALDKHLQRQPQPAKSARDAYLETFLTPAELEMAKALRL